MANLSLASSKTPDLSHLTSPWEVAWSKRAGLPALGSSDSGQSPPSAGLAENTQEASAAQKPRTRQGSSLWSQAEQLEREAKEGAAPGTVSREVGGPGRENVP